MNEWRIGQVAEQTGLSARAIRYYEKLGLARASTRSGGGYRLYSDSDVRRLVLVRDMRTLDFPLAEMRELLSTIDGLTSPDDRRAGATPERLRELQLAIDARCDDLSRRLTGSLEFAARLERIARASS